MNFKIEDVCEINSESIGKNDNYSFINYLDTGNLTEGVVEEIKRLEIGKDKVPSRAKRKVRKDDILISTVRPNQKHYGMVNGEIENLIVSTGFAVIRPSHKVDPMYLYKYLTLPSVVEYLQGIAETSTTAYPSIKSGVIGDIEIDLPPLEEQKAIANILSSLDEKIELNNQMNKTLEEMAQALFKRWFVDFEFLNEEGEPYKSSGGEMVDSELGMIPRGWEVSTLGDIINIGSGKRPPKKSAVSDNEFIIPLIGASSIMGYVSEPLFEEPILVIGRVGTHGVIQRFNNKVWPSDNTLVIKTPYYEYVYQMLKLIDYSAINRGSTQPLITQSDVKASNIIKPSLDIMKKYETIIGKLFEQVEYNNNQSRILEDSRNVLLPKLMSGEIRVTDLQN